MTALPLRAATLAAGLVLCAFAAADTDTPETAPAAAVRTDLSAAELAAVFRARYLVPRPVLPAQVDTDGAVTRQLGTHERHYSVARVGGDGQPEVACLPAESAAAFLDEAADDTREDATQ